ncbi:MAG TPA: HD domain-containing phosphohydrolase [bacterium]|nr:HD domain-containing phosphohydrolase [bacterium]
MIRLKDFGISMLPSGEGLKYVRAQQGLTQGQLAKALGLSLTTINRWERGIFEPTRSHRLALETFCAKHKLPYQQYQIGILAVRLISNYDRYTSGHCTRVCLLAGETGKQVPGIDLVELRVAAVLHDLGKLICDRGLLNKRGRYNPAERERVKEHTVAGEILVAMLMLAHPKAAEIVGQHHERLDGKGYQGLVEKDILPEAKLLSICDVFDALTTKRPYKVEVSVEMALDIIRKDEGLDQCIAGRFAKAIRKPDFLDAMEDDGHVFVYDDRRVFYG